MLQDRRYVERAFEQSATIPGYDIYAHPWYWVRSGKTTLLHNIASQDIRHTVNGRRLLCNNL
jgi:hypothetical protein